MSRICCFALLVAVFPSLALAQREAMTELYGEGVHRYFGGDYVGADEALSTVVQSGSLDPRAHYFLGIVREAQGLGGDADFAAAARLEVDGRRVVDVGQALSRIQGSLRTKIEQARRAARIALAQQQLATPPAAPTTPAAPAPAAPADAATPAPAAPSADDASDPFAGEGMRSGEATVDPTQPTPPAADAAVNPFGDDPAPAPAADATTPPAADNPFGTAPATDEPPAADSPFGGAAPAASDPPAVEAPAGGNPFDMPATEAPAGDSPFGSEPAGDNPFGL